MIAFYKVEVNERHRDNLMTLHDVLISPDRMRALGGDIEFRMSSFVFWRDGTIQPSQQIRAENTATYETISQCGTSCCACGWAVLAGIAKSQSEGWGGYASRQFGVDHDVPLGYYSPMEFLFGGSWNDSPSEAAARIRIYLKHGLPEEAEANAYDSMIDLERDADRHKEKTYAE